MLLPLALAFYFQVNNGVRNIPIVPAPGTDGFYRANHVYRTPGALPNALQISSRLTFMHQVFNRRGDGGTESLSDFPQFASGGGRIRTQNGE